MNAHGSVLFEPLAIGRLVIAGRVIKSATAETRASADGFITDGFLSFYEPMARAGTPLIITGGLYVSHDGQSVPYMAGVDQDDKIPGLERLTRSVHAHGVRIFAQINHCGCQMIAAAVGPGAGWSASGMRDPVTGAQARALSVNDIRRVVDQFAAAAVRCQRAGFDGVQLQAAHGQLIHQFLSPQTNRRRDVYGGSFDNRLRFLRETYNAVRSAVGADFPVILKLSGNDRAIMRDGLECAALVEIARRMEVDGLDAVEVTAGNSEAGPTAARGGAWHYYRDMIAGGLVDQFTLARRIALRLTWPLLAAVNGLRWRHTPGVNLSSAHRFKLTLKIPVIGVGGLGDADRMQAAILSGACDAVACGRAMIADPYLYRHLREGRAGPHCVHCNACAGRVGAHPLDCYHPEIRLRKDAMLAAAR